MTRENLIKSYKHYSKLASGDFSERNFDTVTESKNSGDEEGSMRMGKMSRERIDLIKTSANDNKLDMEKKYPDMFPFKEEVKPKAPTQKRKGVKDA